jgi:3-phenylpropionate/trans-cinnamate dioxygenase ferredoxin reductase subunit
VAKFFAGALGAAGAQFRFGASLVGVDAEHGRLSAIRLSDGTRIPADLLVVAVGASPLVPAGVESTRHGVPVGSSLQTRHADVFAIGDCATLSACPPWRPARIESVQNATDQARGVARSLLGKAAEARATSWFWSDQGTNKLQIAGFLHGCDRFVVRGAPEAGRFSVFGFAAGRLRCVESVNCPADHAAARLLLEKEVRIDLEQAADPSVDLRALAQETVVSG